MKCKAITVLPEPGSPMSKFEPRSLGCLTKSSECGNGSMKSNRVFDTVGKTNHLLIQKSLSSSGGCLISESFSGFFNIIIMPQGPWTRGIEGYNVQLPLI